MEIFTETAVIFETGNIVLKYSMGKGRKPRGRGNGQIFTGNRYHPVGSQSHSWGKSAVDP